MAPMRICLYTDTALPKLGAQEIAVDALARAYTLLGHQPVVLAPWPKHGVSAVQVPYPVLRHPRFFSSHFLTAWYRWFLQSHYERYPFDVLHCHGVYPPSYLAALSRSLIPTPIVVTSYGGDVDERSARLKRPFVLERIIEGLQSADALVAVNPFTRDRLARLCPEAASNIVEIPNGVDVANFARRSARPDRFDADIVPGMYAIFSGRLKYGNGVDVLLQALARTPANGQVQLVVLGDGEDRALLEILTEQLDLRARVRFLSSVANSSKPYLLQNARFGVVSARQRNAAGPAILEGYAAGLPMIATDVPGCGELVRPDRTGLIVPSDAPDELAEAMTRLFADDDLVARLGDGASAYAKSFDWQIIAERHLALYRSLLPVQVSRAA